MCIIVNLIRKKIMKHEKLSQNHWEQNINRMNFVKKAVHTRITGYVHPINRKCKFSNVSAFLQNTNKTKDENRSK